MISNSYRTYLRSAAWQQKREAVARRSRGRCERCGWRRAAEVHHLHYGSLGNENLTDLMHLCRHCHRREHGRGFRLRWRGTLVLLAIAVVMYWLGYL